MYTFCQRWHILHLILHLAPSTAAFTPLSESNTSTVAAFMEMDPVRVNVVRRCTNMLEDIPGRIPPEYQGEIRQVEQSVKGAPSSLLLG